MKNLDQQKNEQYLQFPGEVVTGRKQKNLPKFNTKHRYRVLTTKNARKQEALTVKAE